jgi:hypothetical protein
MSMEGLTRLVVSLMVCGGVAAVDAERPGDAHAAVLHALDLPGGETLSQVFATQVHAIPDPSVGLRVVGLTQALWGAVGRGWLEPHGEGGQALLVLSDVASQELTTDLDQLDEASGGRAMRQAGDAWAAASTRLKNSPNAVASPRSV